jgi:hypothetical protein
MFIEFLLVNLLKNSYWEDRKGDGSMTFRRIIGKQFVRCDVNGTGLSLCPGGVQRSGSTTMELFKFATELLPLSLMIFKWRDFKTARSGL